MIDKMVQDGSIEDEGSQRLGKHVFHSDITKKKPIEVQKALNYDALQTCLQIFRKCVWFLSFYIERDVDNTEPQSRVKSSRFPSSG